MQDGDMLTKDEAHYIGELESLWDMVSDTIKGGRLTEADIPDDYRAFVRQLKLLISAREKVEGEEEKSP